MEGKQCVFNGKTVRYYCSGEGRPIVFLHGFLEDSSIWNDISSVLSSRFKVIAIDLPGHGSTSLFGDVHSIPLMADVVAEVLRMENIRESVLAGHSMGGYAALGFAERYSEKCKGIILVNSTALADSEEKKADRIRAIRVLELNPALFINEAIPNLFAKLNLERMALQVQQIKALALSTSIEGASACLRGMREREDKTEWLRKGKKPVLIIAGKYDNVAPIERSLEQMKMHASIQGVVLEESGHMGFLEEPEKCLEAISDFLEEIG